jgi:ribosomal protein L40E
MQVEEIFLGVMELQEAKNHQLKLKPFGVSLSFKVNSKTCTTGCKVTVEVWANEADSAVIKNHFEQDYLKNIKGHMPNMENLSQVFDPAASEAICQACGAKFSPTVNECPDCGLMY